MHILYPLSLNPLTSISIHYIHPTFTATSRVDARPVNQWSWFRSLGLYLWFGRPSSTDLIHILSQYHQAVQSGVVATPYHAMRSGGEVHDVMYGLIQLYVKQQGPTVTPSSLDMDLMKVMQPLAYSRTSTDHSIQLLISLLLSDMLSSPSHEQVVTNITTQLSQLNMWQWCVYVHRHCSNKPLQQRIDAITRILTDNLPLVSYMDMTRAKHAIPSEQEISSDNYCYVGVYDQNDNLMDDNNNNNNNEDIGLSSYAVNASGMIVHKAEYQLVPRLHYDVYGTCHDDTVMAIDGDGDSDGDASYSIAPRYFVASTAVLGNALLAEHAQLHVPIEHSPNGINISTSPDVTRVLGDSDVEEQDAAVVHDVHSYDDYLMSLDLFLVTACDLPRTLLHRVRADVAERRGLPMAHLCHTLMCTDMTVGADDITTTNTPTDTLTAYKIFAHTLCPKLTIGGHWGDLEALFTAYFQQHGYEQGVKSVLTTVEDIGREVTVPPHVLAHVLATPVLTVSGLVFRFVEITALVKQTIAEDQSLLDDVNGTDSLISIAQSLEVLLSDAKMVKPHVDVLCALTLNSLITVAGDVLIDVNKILTERGLDLEGKSHVLNQVPNLPFMDQLVNSLNQ